MPGSVATEFRGLHPIRQHGWLLVAAFLLLAPFKTLYEWPMGVMALVGMALLALRSRETVQLPGFRVLLTLFLLIWTPMLLSLPDAFQPARAVSTTLTHLRYFFAGVFMLVAMQESRARKHLLLAAGLLLAFWSVDGTIQAILGKNLLGNPIGGGGRVGGVYFPRLTLGHALATMSPLLLLWIWGEAGKRHSRLLLLLLLLPALLVTVILSGSRVAWIMLVLSLVLVVGYCVAYTERRALRRAWPVVLVAVMLAGTFLSGQDPLQQRWAQTAKLASGEADLINEATSQRVGIWDVGTRMFRDHWLNGIGPRGFRYAYGAYCDPGDPAFNPETHLGITHPHLLSLEIAVETGVIGVLGYLAFLGVFVRSVVRAGRERLREAWPFAAAAFISFFPLNAGHAFYGGKWGCIVWWLTALAVAHLSVGKKAESP